MAPALIREPSAAEQASAQTFVELLLRAPWDPALPMAAAVASRSDSPVSPTFPASPLEAAQPSAPLPSADVVPMGGEDDDSGGGYSSTGWTRPAAPGRGTGSLFSGGDDQPVRAPLRDLADDTDDDTSRMTAPESTDVLSFKQSPPSHYDEGSGADGGGGGAPAAAAGDAVAAVALGPAWTTQVDQEDVLSSLEFANPGPMFRQPGADMILDDDFDDLEMEDLETL